MRLFSYKASIRLRSKYAIGLDYDDLVKEIKKFKPKPERPKGGESFVICVADLQLGKKDGDGTIGTIQAFQQSVANIKQRVKELRRIGREIGTLYVVGMGDIIENCFAGETEILTKDGIKTLKELSIDGTATVKSRYGKWVDADIKSFGQQRLYKLTVSRSGAKQEIYTTKEHGWFVLKNHKTNHGQIRKRTDGLEVGDYLASNFGNHPLTLSPFGIARGFVYGDGHLGWSKNKNNGSCLNMHRKDWDSMLKYFEGCSQSEVKKHTDTQGMNLTEMSDYIRIGSMPSYFKSERPSLDESPSYLMGWLAGYFAADGSVDKNGYCTMSSASIEDLQFFAEVCSRVGIGTNPILTSNRKGCNDYDSEIHKISLLKHTIPEYFFVQEKHRERFMQEPKLASTGRKNHSLCWRVESVEETDRYEEVYCAVVPGDHSFTLKHDILTSNCSDNYAQQLFTVELNLRDQLKVARRLIRDAIAELAPMFDTVVVSAVPGNHGEASRRGGKNVTDDADNHDVALFEVLAEVFAANPAFDHVRFLLPNDEMFVVLDISGVNVCFAHGHRTKGGANPTQKQKSWWSDMAFTEQPPGDALILVTAHYHHLIVIDHGPKTHIQCPALDGGSKWWADMGGGVSKRGILTFVIDENGHKDLEVL